MKKYLTKSFSLLLSFIMLVSTLSVTFSAYAANGTGTASDPYQISTASALQAINNNPSAHYKLTANINLSGMEFEPIGNVDSGAFTGSFDGNGFTISNLNVYSGKYAALFGYNDGLVKNVTLSSVSVFGTKYIAGVVAYNGSNATLQNCSVLGGSIKSEGAISSVYAGGIVGYNAGLIQSNGAKLENSANIDINSTTSIWSAGIIGYSSSTLNLTNCKNYGSVSAYNSNSYARAAGIVSESSKTIYLNNSDNYGEIYAHSAHTSYSNGESLSGGLVSFGTVQFSECSNKGNVSSSSFGYSYSGGFVGVGTINASNSYNNGKVSSYSVNYKSFSGGFVSYNNSSNFNIESSFNSGNVSSSSDHDYSYSGGFVGYANNSYGISNSYNLGNIDSKYYSGGFTGYHESTNFKTIANNCYNAGSVHSKDRGFTAGISGIGGLLNIRANITNTYTLTTSFSNWRYSYGNGELLTPSQMKSASNFKGWDFDTTWTINPNINNGYPVLKVFENLLTLNVQTVSGTGGRTQLYAYRNGSKVNDVTWSVTNGSASVTTSGKVEGYGLGCSTVTATDSYGNKANCNLFGVTNSVTSLSATDRTINITEGTVDNNNHISVNNPGEYDGISSYQSSAPAICSVDGDGYLTPHSAGVATITITTFGGKSTTQKVTVTSYATSVSLPSSVSVKLGDTYQLNATTNPANSSSKKEWSSSASDIVSVDSNGKLTANKTGSAVITVKCNGYSASCNVTVYSPIESMVFENQNYTVYTNDQVDLNLIYTPKQTTETITYSVSNSSYGSVSSDGIFTASSYNTGTTTVTATASGGKKATCTVKVVNYPVAVTGLTLDKTEKDIYVGEAFKLNATVSPSNATDKTVTWESTDSSVATVSIAGAVEAKGAGKTVITATSSSGIVKYCVVNVKGVASSNISKIYIPTLQAKNGDTVDVPVMIKNNPGISFASIRVLYGTGLEPVSVSNGNVFPAVIGAIDNTQKEVNLYFNADGDIDSDGILATIRVKVNDIDNASLKLCYFPGEIINANVNAVSLNMEDGMLISLSAECSHEHTRVENKKAASCYEYGYSGDIYCDDCGELIKCGSVIEKTAHTWDSGVVVKTADCANEGIKRYTCTVCKETKDDTIAKTAHSYVTQVVAPTYDSEGYTNHICSVCGDNYKSDFTNKLVRPTPTPTQPTTNSTQTSAPITNAQPAPAPTPAKPTTAPTTAAPTTATQVEQTTTAQQTAEPTTQTTTIAVAKPKGAKIKKATGSKKAIALTWAKVKGVKGYQIQVATDKKFKKNKKTVTIKKQKTTKTTVKKLKSKKKYFVRIRTYKTVNGKKIYSSWSKAKTVKTK